MNRSRLFLKLAAFVIALGGFAQLGQAADPVLHQVLIPWIAADQAVEAGLKAPAYQIDGGIYESRWQGLPLFVGSLPVKSDRSQIRISQEKWEPLATEDPLYRDLLPAQLDWQYSVSTSKGRQQAIYTLLPFKQVNGRSYRLISFQLELEDKAPILTTTRNTTFKTESVLRKGNFYKLAVSQPGVYRIDYNFLKNTLKLNPEQIDPRNIRIWGTGGGKLPEKSSVERVDDLEELSISVSGESDGAFNNGDFILFWGQGPDHWDLAGTTVPYFNMTKNIYDTKTCYFLEIADMPGKRIQAKEDLAESEFVSTGFDDYIRLEDEQTNLLASYTSSQGGGKDWFGDYFDLKNSYDYTGRFNFPNIIITDSARVDFRFAGRFDSSASSGAPVRVSIDGKTFSAKVQGTKVSDPEVTYAHIASLNQRFLPAQDNLGVSVSFPPVPGSSETKGWLDYVQINARRQLVLSGDWMSFRDLQAMKSPSAHFAFQAATAYQVWDITQSLSPAQQPVQNSGGVLSFNTLTGGLREFVAFRNEASLPEPTFVSLVGAQNLHAINGADMIVIYHPDFKEASDRIVRHRKEHSQLDVVAVNIEEIYNEFAGGSLDPIAIRDFLRMVYTRDSSLAYVLFIGDGTYDYRNIRKTIAYENFIPVYETDESENPINTYPTDDFFAQLDANEGGNLFNDGLDIAIGRLPVRTASEANAVIDKIIHYDTSPFSLGEWRLNQCLVGDDNTAGYSENFFTQTEDIGNPLAAKFPFFNVNKIQFDAYKESYTPGGERHPLVKNAINDDIYKGLLVINYLGHGGPNGWAQERILELKDIHSWDNYDRMPLMITATCSFAGFDDPNVNSAGELTLRKPDGGVVALFTTVRAVYAWSNFTLANNVFKNLFVKENGHYITIGETLRRAKSPSNNDRKFTLLGDPAMKLAVPEWNIEVSEINGKAVSETFTDTARALSTVKVKGRILDELGNFQPGFNGTLSTTVFDKPTQLKTLGQGSQNKPVRTFQVQQSVIFKGETSVKNGEFEFTFVVPLDINYNFGAGKISLYASDGISRDAAGAFAKLIIGGTNEDNSDDQAPTVSAFINSFDFRSGGITGPNPTLLLKLADDTGINVSGTSIGHDLTATINGDDNNKIILNSYYKTTLDDHTQGTVFYPLNITAPGTYRIDIKAWDVANNSATGTTTFTILDNKESVIGDINAYPNPFSDQTCISFQHNLNGFKGMATIDIFDAIGREVKQILYPLDESGSAVACIPWDGTSDDASPLPRGVYMFRIALGNGSGPDAVIPPGAQAKFGKVVLMK